MRFEVVRIFSEWLSTESGNLKEIAVVGGTSRDAEVSILKNQIPSVAIDYYGIDNPHDDEGFTFLDLNYPGVQITKKYDLVICSQVLEHVYNLENTFNSLAALTKGGGFLWVNCPASNMVHGSPHFYSAGYAPEYLSENLAIRGLHTLKSESIGSKRYYFMTHILRFWATEREHQKPVLGYNFQPGTFLGICRKLLVDLPGRFLSLLYSKKITDDVNFSTETVVLAQAKEF